MIIAVDAVGGDHYPQHPVEGALKALEENNDLQLLLLGPGQMIREELSRHPDAGDRLTVQDAPQVIGMDEAPAQAVKSKQKSSIALGLGLHAKGRCQAFVSAGNTGALLAASTLILGKLEGVHRPTITANYPTVKGFRPLLDVGANLEMRPEMYRQFAIMGCIYAETMLGVEEPTVGLLNVGEEEEKGTEGLKKAYRELRSLPQFIGNVEGRDIFPAKADVFLCDGLIGNILLKFGESIPGALQQFVGKAVKKAGLDREQAAQVTGVLKGALAEFQHETIGGIPFLGVDGVSMVGHGGSSPTAIKNMILEAVKCVENNVNDRIVASLNE
ncbi:MAG: phosphate acyltransferase PlsX [Balneolaceae bacterium]|nr:phosphate acyltransferase PlsX [Balneolaceae bacterium]